MATTQSTLVAVFRNRTDAENAANELRANGFGSGDVYVGSYSNTSTTGGTREWSSTHHHEGGIKGWFKSLFGDNDDASDYNDYENAASSGNVILTVNAAEANLDRAEQILQKYNPVDINENASNTSATTTGRTSAAGTAATNTRAAASASTSSAGVTGAAGKQQRTRDTDLPKSIPVVQEELQVGKRAVLRGGVRVYSQVVQKPVEETVNLREERVSVDRQPVNRPAQAGDLRAGTEQVIEVQEYAEEPVVQKQARVVEEVRINKNVSERSETVRDTVRQQDVRVENLGQTSSGTSTGGATDTGNYGDDFRNHFQTRYGSSGGRYEDYEPAYQYGYNAAGDPRYQGRNWDDVESDLRSDYGRRYPNSTWERMKESIRYGWDKVTGRARGASGHGD
jgi:uncharacterized protein (TIGR02271 family)